YVPPSREPLVLLAALAAGFIVGVAPLQQMMMPGGVIHDVCASAGITITKPGIINFVIVNLALPAIAVALAIFFPRLRTATAAGALVVFGFALGRWSFIDPRPWTWQPRFLLANTHPILVAAIVGCALVGAMAALAATPVRRVGVPRHEPSCPRCGH